MFDDISIRLPEFGLPVPPQLRYHGPLLAGSRHMRTIEGRAKTCPAGKKTWNPVRNGGFDGTSTENHGKYKGNQLEMEVLGRIR